MFLKLKSIHVQNTVARSTVLSKLHMIIFNNTSPKIKTKPAENDPNDRTENRAAVFLK